MADGMIWDNSPSTNSLTVRSDGTVQLNYGAGKTLVFTGSSALGISVNNDQYHNYTDRTAVGVLPGFENSKAVTDLYVKAFTGARVLLPIDSWREAALPTIDLDQAYFMTRRFAAPTWGSDAHLNPVRTGDLSAVVMAEHLRTIATGEGEILSFTGPVMHAVYENAYVVVNVTMPGHALHPGLVVRINYVENGIVFTETLGIGIGDFGESNVEVAKLGLWEKLSLGARDAYVEHGLGSGPPDRRRVSDVTEEEVYEKAMEERESLYIPFCFASGTPIQLADGSTKRIEDVRVGEWVSSVDSESRLGPLVFSQVVSTHETQNQRLVNLFDGTRVTPGHVFLSGDGLTGPQSRSHPLCNH